ncbi:MAG: putative Ig domain-containing protein, partial [Planctomycetota bacterium]
SSGYLIEKNTLYGNVNGINADGLETSEIKNNLIYDNTSRGIYLNGNLASISSRDNLVLNNTVVVPSAGGNVVFIIRFAGGIPEATGNKLYNNILYHYGTAADDYTICIDTAAETGFESDYNVVMEYFGLDDGGTTLTFSEWQARGYDGNSIQASDTDLFTDPATNDYTLKSTSPAKNAGTTRAEVTDDIEGNSRPQGAAYDIGCYEYVEAIPNLVITTTSLDDGVVGEGYSQTCQATGGVTPYSWAVVTGSLPAGLSLNSSTGEISGTPTSAGTSNFTVEVTDSQGTPDSDTQALSITIFEDLVVTTSSLPDGTVGAAYSETVAATGGLPPYDWSVVSGNLPAGLSLNSLTGEISGTPTTAETANFTVEVADSANPSDSDQQALSITIYDDLDITTSILPDGTEGVAYSQTLAATGGLTPYTWSVVSGSLPAGLSLNSSTGDISGTPTTAETANFTVEVTDSQAVPDSDQQALSITVNPSQQQYQVTFQQGLDSYTGWEDSWIDGDNATTNYGTIDKSHLQYYSDDRQLHKFDLSSIPAGATIDSATLEIYAYKVTRGTPPIYAFRVMTPWEEMEVTYNNATTGVAWGVPGLQPDVDYDSTTAVLSPDVTGAGWASMDITSFVAAWHAGTYANEGVMLKIHNPGHIYSYMEDYTNDITLRPRLVVTYTY